MSNIQTLIEIAVTQLEGVSDSARLDAEILLAYTLEKPRSHLRAWPEKLLTETQLNQFKGLLRKRSQGVPIAYLTGYREFWSLPFKVTPAVLIPRPETELLVELSLELLTDKPAAHIIDLGTGSGVIAITLAVERPDLTVIASDLSAQTLAVAQDNAAQHQTTSIQFIQSDWLSDIPAQLFDLVISNPPYIDSEDPHLLEGDVRFEPNRALIASEQGLGAIKKLCHQAGYFLKPGGYLLIEHGYHQQSAVQAIFNTFNYQSVVTHTDLAGIPRVTMGQWKPL